MRALTQQGHYNMITQTQKTVSYEIVDGIDLIALNNPPG